MKISSNTLFVKYPGCKGKFWIQTTSEYFINQNGESKITHYYPDFIKED